MGGSPRNRTDFQLALTLFMDWCTKVRDILTVQKNILYPTTVKFVQSLNPGRGTFFWHRTQSLPITILFFILCVSKADVELTTLGRRNKNKEGAFHRARKFVGNVFGGPLCRTRRKKVSKRPTPKYSQWQGHRRGIHRPEGRTRVYCWLINGVRTRKPLFNFFLLRKCCRKTGKSIINRLIY